MGGPIGVLGRNVLRLVVPGQSQGHDLVLNQSHQEMESRVQERNHKTLLVKKLYARVITKYLSSIIESNIVHHQRIITCYLYFR